jgi:hypothetical protein
VATGTATTGVYTIDYSAAQLQQSAVIQVTPIEAVCTVKSVVASSTLATISMANADSTTLKDCAFNVTIFGSKYPEQYGL